ncbi:hypothetical protein HFO97_01205 [Rhizobium leguminosarum]|uniref:hypothetical protein n=1 Tax=Rhizobium leguminosarum TaxID=384 RepID=UPI001C939CF7|nr:hypothetical protein [Rhizobium leguminosarum]MBY5358634.1 hypothetical protein [Rhizobium leguminosarum]
MTIDNCSACKAALSGLASDKKQAERVEQLFPGCACEKYSVGAGSPGPVVDEEIIYRMVISPGDIDDEGNLLMEALKDVKLDGLSVFRESATDEDIVALVTDRLTRRASHEPRVVQALIMVKTGSVRELSKQDHGRLFCVYDETVPRKNPTDTPVATHVTILQRLQKEGTANRRGLIKAGQKALYDEIHHQRVAIATFRDGLIEALNERSLAGDFVLQEIEAA